MKISFKTMNEGRISTISGQELSESSNRIKLAMKKVVKEYEKNEVISLREARKLVLNS